MPSHKIKKMAKKGNRVQVILECTEHKDSGMPGTSGILQLRTERTLQTELNLKSSTYIKEIYSS